MKQAAQRILVQGVRSARPVARATPAAACRPSRTFSSTRFHLQQQQEQAKQEGEPKAEEQQSKQKQQAKEEEPDTTVAGRSPFAAFVEVLREEVRKNREWQDSVKQLGGEVGKVQDSEAMKRAKDAYERARLAASIKENPRLAAAANELRKAGISINDAVGTALKGMEETAFVRTLSKASRAVGDAAYTASAPVRDTEAYKAVAAEITDLLENAANDVQHGGYIDREARRKRRAARLAKIGKERGMAQRRLKVEEDTEAGQAITLHATANKEPKESRLPKPIADAMAQWSHTYAESDNPFIVMSRSVTGTVGRWFDETETAKVSKWVKQMDPEFTQESFLKELREYIVPELVDAYVNGDQPTLKQWCSEATFNVLIATLGNSIGPAMMSESRVLDIRNLDIMSAKILENDLHVFVVSWRTQEVLAYRDLKSNEIAVGDENKIQQVGYVAVLTRVEEELDNEETGGWKVIDMARRAA
ncbi:protein translocase subunit TIM44 [Sporobolomyces koalae]|uniref:protein translocase subunit TIM44 n=1 Tax=Sporobolomyces koalae TaxID=500713 RepID=UPI00317DCB27